MPLLVDKNTSRRNLSACRMRAIERNALLPFPCVAIDANLVMIALSERYQINYWDAAIVAAAERLEAPVVYSEDFNPVQSYGSVRVLNPFA